MPLDQTQGVLWTRIYAGTAAEADFFINPCGVLCLHRIDAGGVANAEAFTAQVTGLLVDSGQKRRLGETIGKA